MTTLSKLHGVVPPVSTPFTADGEIDIASLERLLRYLLDGGVHGIFALGSTSEVGALSDAQRRTVLEATIATVSGQVPVLAGVIDMSTARMIEHAGVARDLGADAIVATGPYYINPGQAEIIDHYHRLRNAVDIPIMAYNIPQNVQTVLSKETLQTLAQDGTIIGIKDSSGNEVNFRTVIAETRDIEGFAVFTGSELTADYAMFTGAHGIVPGLGNVDPKGYCRLYDLCMAEDWVAARAEQERLARLFQIIFQATPGRVGFTSGALGGFKTALRELGVIDTNGMAPPMTPLNDDETARIRAILEESGLL